MTTPDAIAAIRAAQGETRCKHSIILDGIRYDAIEDNGNIRATINMAEHRKRMIYKFLNEKLNGAKGEA